MCVCVCLAAGGRAGRGRGPGGVRVRSGPPAGVRSVSLPGRPPDPSLPESGDSLQTTTHPRPASGLQGEPLSLPRDKSLAITQHDNADNGPPLVTKPPHSYLSNARTNLPTHTHHRSCFSFLPREAWMRVAGALLITSFKIPDNRFLYCYVSMIQVKENKIICFLYAFL